MFLMMALMMCCIGFFTSCNKSKEDTFVKNNGKVMVENGKGVSDSIPYTCEECEKNKVDTVIFNEIVKEATLETRNSLKYPLSFIPKSIEIEWIKQDSLQYFDNGNIIENVFSIYYNYKYIAKNGYGNELEGDFTDMIFMKDGQIMKYDDFGDEIKLMPLEFDEEGVPNREFITNSALDDAYISILPTLTKLFSVNSSIDCVDEGAELSIRFDNGKTISLISWNDFNCEGLSYFGPLNESQIEMFKMSKVRSLVLIDKGTVISTSVPKNQADYFIQLVNIFENK